MKPYLLVALLCCTPFSAYAASYEDRLIENFLAEQGCFMLDCPINLNTPIAFQNGDGTEGYCYPLLAAAGQLSVTRFNSLIRLGANPEIQDYQTDQTIMHYAAINATLDTEKKRSMVEYIHQNLPQLAAFLSRKPDRRGNLPLHYAIQCKNTAAIHILAALYPDTLMQENNAGVSPLRAAHDVKIVALATQNKELLAQCDELEQFLRITSNLHQAASLIEQLFTE
jgi:ankyrin repeat protein